MGMCVLSVPAFAQDVTSFVSQQLPGLVTTYKTLHAAPELSHHEEKTSSFVASELRKAGYSVTERVGRYYDGSQAFGVVGILKNGQGPTLLIRADMDALPVTEDTGLPYASKVRSTNPAGLEVGVMHACGHDIHVTTLIGMARAMAALKSQWHGTLMLVGQPSEETIDSRGRQRSDRDGGRVHYRASDDRQPFCTSTAACRRHRRADTRRYQAQHYSRRGQDGADDSRVQRRGPPDHH